MKTLHIAAAIIVKDKQKILATQRGYGEFKGGWEFPGGKVEPGESAEQALVREIKEELDGDIKVLRLFDTIDYQYPTFKIHMECFLAEPCSSFTLLEHTAAKWLTKENLLSVPWLPADIGVAEQLQRALD